MTHLGVKEEGIKMFRLTKGYLYLIVSCSTTPVTVVYIYVRCVDVGSFMILMFRRQFAG
jgi:hypothetical protein